LRAAEISRGDFGNAGGGVQQRRFKQTPKGTAFFALLFFATTDVRFIKLFVPL